MAEQTDIISATRKMIASQIGEVNTRLPGTIVSYANGRAGVLPTGKKRFPDGDSLDFPIIQNVRIEWPSFAGGLAGIKGPIKPGDKCLIIFAQQAVDGSDDMRKHDLTDAYAIMCDNGNAGPGDSGNNDDMTMYFGSAYIRITQGGAVKIYAPAGTEIDTPETVNTGRLKNKGSIDGQQGIAIVGSHDATGKASTCSGSFIVTSGDVIADGIGLKTHKHTGVQTGTGTSGGPVA